MPWWIALPNTLAALASTGFGLVAAVRPALVAPPEAPEATPGRFYSAMYAGRAVPLGLAVALVVWTAPTDPVAVLLLGVAIVAQATDVIVGVARRLTGMVAGATFALVCHGAALLATT